MERAPASEGGWADAVVDEVRRRERPSLRPVFNATGVVLHTNLGRAPLADAAVRAITDTASGASNLEYDLDRGTRGSRYAHCVELLCELTGAEDALVVNNCASALVLALNTFAEGREAVVSRGELIEIGGSFRVPDIMAKSGARLREVGTTNRTHLDDYVRAVGPEVGALVKVHRSNFEVRGFVAEVSLQELEPVAAKAGVPLLFDFGSGLMIPLDAYGLGGEPTAAEGLRAGASVLVMSGDKLLGGPQAGIMLGRADAIAACRKNPLVRALRVDKLTLAALGATLTLYREPSRAVRDVPALAMLTASAGSVEARARRLCGRLAAAGVAGDVVATEATVGGGSFPAARIPSWGVALGGDAEDRERLLRLGESPVVGHIVDDLLVVELRSVPEALDEELAAAIVAALGARMVDA